MKTAHKSERNQEDMVGMMSKLVRQQAAPDIDINTLVVTLLITIIS